MSNGEVCALSVLFAFVLEIIRIILSSLHIIFRHRDMNVGTKATHNPGRRPTTTPFTQPPARSPNEPHNYLGRFWPILRFIGMLCYFLTAFIFITFLLCFFYCFFFTFSPVCFITLPVCALKMCDNSQSKLPFR